MPSKRSAEEALAIVRSLKERYLTPEIAQGAEQGRERLRRLREGRAEVPGPAPASEPAPADARPQAPPPEEPAFTEAEREKARAVLAAIRRRLHAGARPAPMSPPTAGKPILWRPKG